MIPTFKCKIYCEKKSEILILKIYKIRVHVFHKVGCGENTTASGGGGV